MPSYSLKCLQCGEHIEITQKMDEPLPHIHGQDSTGRHCLGTLEQILTPPALSFKGSGWYVTDYKGK